jgi:preprotein translocase subunit SecF
MYVNGFDDFQVVNFGSNTDVLIKVADKDGSSQLGDTIFAFLEADDSSIELQRIEFVGPQIGSELRDQGGLGMLVALGMILLYVAFRFQYKFALGAVAALGHDVVIILGLFSLLNWDFDLTVLAALLAVIGYSLNDTIVVFDRIRENFRVIRKGTIEHIMNVSIHQTLPRTIITSLTTMLVLIALYFLGGAIIHGFALALIIGVGVGTYSSIFVASTSLLAMGLTREALMPVVKEGENLDDPNDGNFGAQV